MAQFKNVSPLGELDIPSLGHTVKAGEVFDVPSELTRYFEKQTENFQLVKPAKATKPAATKATKPAAIKSAKPDASVAPGATDSAAPPADGDDSKGATE